MPERHRDHLVRSGFIKCETQGFHAKKWHCQKKVPIAVKGIAEPTSNIHSFGFTETEPIPDPPLTQGNTARSSILSRSLR